MNLSHTLYVTVEVKAINDVIVINSVMNLSHTLHVTVNVKALLSILYNSGNIQIKSCRGPIAPPPLSHFKLAKTSVSRGLNYVGKV